MKVGLIILIVVVGATSVAVVVRLLREPFRSTATWHYETGPSDYCPSLHVDSRDRIVLELREVASRTRILPSAASQNGVGRGG